jgi:ribose/xylose/arabinose/galactoside ABC-type transport system permease subunit
LSRRRERWSPADGWIDLLFVPAILLVLLVYLSISADGFLDKDNLTNVLLQGSILALVAFGMTFLILAGELDLSVGSGVALVSVVAALVMRDSGSVGLGVLAGLGAGAALGLANGLIVTKLEVPAFIATLGTLVIAHGIALALTNGAVIGPVPEGIGSLARDTFLGVRWLIWLVVAVFVALYLLQRRMTFGITVMSVGGNREAARLSGINVDRVRMLCFVLAGATVGIAGIALTSRVSSGQPNAGSLLALTAIAAVVVGGTSLIGGRGSVA